MALGRRAGLSFVARITALTAACMVLGGSSVLAQDAPPPRSGDIIPGHYLVTFEANVADHAQEARRLAAALGFGVRHIYTAALSGMAIEVPAASELAILDALQRNPRVRSIGNDRYIAAVAQFVPTGIDRIEAEPPLPPPNTGAGIRVAIIDTGLDFTHPDLAPNIDEALSRDCINGGGGCVPGGGDDNGHGTFVGGIVAALHNDQHVVGVAPEATLIAVKVLNATGSGSFTDIIAAVDDLTRLATNPVNPDVIEVANMSLGATCGVCTDSSSDPTIAAFQLAVRALHDAGTTVIVAAGNDGADARNTVPAAFPEVITVSALTDTDGSPGGNGPRLVGGLKDDTFARFSNFGAAVDVIAPGVNISSLGLGGGMATGSGTSFASPHAAGVAAIFIRDRLDRGEGLPPPDAVRQALIETGECRDGDDGTVIHDGIGCTKTWRNDRDGIAEPMVRADTVVTWGPALPPPDVHDVAVTSVDSPSPVLMNSNENVLVGIANEGTVAETFEVTLSDSLAAAISNPPQPTTLAPGATATLTFSWTPTVVGNHVLTATADTVAGETDTADNSRGIIVSVQEPTHDIAVISIAAPASITQGSTADITVDVANEGTFVETFTVDVTDTPPVGGTAGVVSGFQTPTLTAGGSTTLTFTWITTSASLGDHALDATAEIVPGEIDAADNMASTVASVVVEPPAEIVAMHVGDLDGAGTSQGGTWTATVTITVHDPDHSQPIEGAEVSGSWSRGDRATSICTTPMSGTCSVTSGSIDNKRDVVEFRVESVSGTPVYESGNNHDPDGDSDGSRISVLQPSA